MPTPAEYQSRAAECDDMARLTKDTGMRETLLELAAQWREIAQDQPQTRRRQIWIDPSITPDPNRRGSN